MSIEISSKFGGQLLREIKLCISRPCWNTRWNTSEEHLSNLTKKLDLLKLWQNLASNLVEYYILYVNDLL